MAGHGSSILRYLILFNNFIIWLSAVIVMSLVSYFISKYSNRVGQHLIYWEVIACLTVFFWLAALVLPLFGRYRSYYLPMQLIFSYLWLTSFIFSAQDYNWHDCVFNSPTRVGRCGRKLTVEAFNFIAFIFLFFNVLLEGWLLWAARPTPAEHRKDSHATSSTVAAEPHQAPMQEASAPGVTAV